MYDGGKDRKGPVETTGRIRPLRCLVSKRKTDDNYLLSKK